MIKSQNDKLVNHKHMKDALKIEKSPAKMISLLQGLLQQTPAL